MCFLISIFMNKYFFDTVIACFIMKFWRKFKFPDKEILFGLFLIFTLKKACCSPHKNILRKNPHPRPRQNLDGDLDSLFY